MKENKSVINIITTKLLFPYILCFAFYVQIFGEIAPGGGFQAGAIFSSGMIAYDISIKNITSSLSSLALVRFGAFGTLIYLLTGLFALFDGKNFLNYYAISENFGQAFGIMIVEFGVGITVFSIMLFLYMEIKVAK